MWKFLEVLTGVQKKQVTYDHQLMMNQSALNAFKVIYGSEAIFEKAYGLIELNMLIEEKVKKEKIDTSKEGSLEIDMTSYKKNPDDYLHTQTNVIFKMCEMVQEAKKLPQGLVIDSYNTEKLRISKADISNTEKSLLKTYKNKPVHLRLISQGLIDIEKNVNPDFAPQIKTIHFKG